MPYVVDASVAASWVLPDEHHAVAELALARTEEDAATAPWLLWSELRNILIVAERRGRLQAPKTEEALLRLSKLSIALDGAPDELATIALARRHRLTVYDAAYLELALRKAIPLATLDVALAEAARSEGVSLIE